MLTTCLACHTPFPANDTLEHFPTARRIAFDPARGRLWAICPSCARWTLAPFASRWEALEELERVTRDRARLLVETDNIGLLTAGDIEIVRVGRAGLREESWWRFGKEFARRRKRAKRTTLKGKIYEGALFLLLTGIPYWGMADGQRWIDRDRRKQFGKDLWREPLHCDRCGHELKRVRFQQLAGLTLRPGPDDAEHDLALALQCPRCRRQGVHHEHLLTGVRAEHMLRRSLAYRNFAGGTEALVDDAVHLVESHPSAHGLIARAAHDHTGLDVLDPRRSFALEIALNTDVERRLLAMELKDLEARWKREEEIAAIADTL